MSGRFSRLTSHVSRLTSHVPRLTSHVSGLTSRVAWTLSFTTTSDELHLSQSVVSRTIQTIEKKTGVELFSRTSRSVEITSAGTELLAIVDRTIATHGAGLARFEKFLACSAGSVSVVALPSVAATVVPPVVRSFAETRPDIAVSVSDGLADEIVEWVAVGRADLGLTAQVAHVEQLIQSRWVSDELLALLPSGHPLTSRPPVTWSDLAASLHLRTCGWRRGAHPSAPGDWHGIDRDPTRSGGDGGEHHTKRDGDMRQSLRDIAHVRTGDKGALITVSVTCYEHRRYPVLVAQLSCEVVATYLAPRIRGRPVRYELPKLATILFVCARGRRDTVNTRCTWTGTARPWARPSTTSR